MRSIPSYPIWISASMLLGPLLMVAGAWFRSLYVIWICQVVGAFMVVLVLFYVSKRLHEQMEEVASLRQLLNERENPD